MMLQPLDTSDKRGQLIATGQTLIWRHGIKRVSIEEICREAGVSKMTFYKHFKNKADLVIVIFDTILDQAMAQYDAIMQSDQPFAQKVEALIRLKQDQTLNLSKALMAEIHQTGGPELVAYFQNVTRKNIQVVMRDLIDAQKRGDLRQDLKPEFILYFMNHMFEMAEDGHLAALYETPQALIMELTQFFFYGIIPRQGTR